jgi:hypothetical protein
MNAFSIGASLLGLAALVQCQAVITSDTYFYGQSPPVYPSRTLRHPRRRELATGICHPPGLTWLM